MLKRLLSQYLVVSGLALHMALLAVLAHFLSTGLSPHRYVTKGIQFLDRDSSPTRHVARAARLVLLDSGLVPDPAVAFPPDIAFELPPWRGAGASALREASTPRYARSGTPVSQSDRDLWLLTTPPTTSPVEVASEAALRDAVARGRPGDEIILQPGTYVVREALALEAEGKPGAPLIVRGMDIGDVVVVFEGRGRFQVSGSYWSLSDMIVRQRCANAPCPAPVRVDPTATGFTARNLFVSGAETFIHGDGPSSGAVPHLADGITIVGGDLLSNETGWRQQSIREVNLPSQPKGFLLLCPPGSMDAECDGHKLSELTGRIAADGLILIRNGEYTQAASLNKRGLHLLAEPGAALRRRNTGGKGALVVNASVTIEGLECSHVTAPDGNGCCVRQQTGDVDLLGVHFHHSQMGVLTGHRGGHIRIMDSYFHDSGYDRSGQLGHNVYVNSGKLEFIRSWSVAARNAGHELKSRASSTTIIGSLVASFNARDSRLIDVPDGGVLTVTGSVLGEGPRSENWDLIGFGLEVKKGRPAHPLNEIRVNRNTIYVDRARGGNLLNQKHADLVEITDNVVVGDANAPAGNARHDSREDVGARPYPHMDPKTL